MFKRNHKAKTQQSINQTNLECELTSFLTHFIYQIGRLNEMIKRESDKKMFHLQMMSLGLKTAHYEKSRHHLVLKILGVCSSHQDQHFWFLNQVIRSWNERVMVKLRFEKLWEKKSAHTKFCSSFHTSLWIAVREGIYWERVWSGEVSSREKHIKWPIRDHT